MPNLKFKVFRTRNGRLDRRSRFEAVSILRVADDTSAHCIRHQYPCKWNPFHGLGSIGNANSDGIVICEGQKERPGERDKEEGKQSEDSRWRSRCDRYVPRKNRLESIRITLEISKLIQ